jgi:hypothetical protein
MLAEYRTPFPVDCRSTALTLTGFGGFSAVAFVQPLTRHATNKIVM